MAVLTSAFILFSSSGVGGRFSYPISCIRTVVAPTKEATLVDMPLSSRYWRYSPSVVHSISYFMSPCASFSSFLIVSLSGPIDQPSPIISSVTPCRMSLWEFPSSIREAVAQLSILMNPGDTASPVASIIWPAVLPSRFRTASTLLPMIPISVITPSLPDPS